LICESELLAGLRAETLRVVAALPGVSVSGVVKWSLRYKASGSVALGKMGGDLRPTREMERDFVLTRIAENPNIASRELQAVKLLAEGGDGFPQTLGYDAIVKPTWR
jgi:hypothetical protein